MGIQARDAVKRALRFGVGLCVLYILFDWLFIDSCYDGGGIWIWSKLTCVGELSP